MSFPPAALSVPLATDADGVVRVAGTRVPLDTVAAAFGEGATVEEIVQQYPSLALADVYAVVAYVLRDEAEVGEYLRGRQARAAEVQAEHERQHDASGIRTRLLARRVRAA